MTEYLDRIERREVSISRYATSLINEHTNPNLRQSYLTARSILLDAEEITSITKLNKILAEIKKAIEPETELMYNELTGELNDFAVEEALFSAKILSQASGVAISAPVRKTVVGYVEKALMSLQSGQVAQAGTWAEFVNNSTESIVKTYNNQIKAGYANGETVSQMTKRLRTVTNGILKSQAEALVRTGTQHYAQQARNAMRDDNLDVIAREVPVITFDNRTTDICISIAEKYPEGWKTGESPVGYPPYHWGCRTTIAYLTEGKKSLVGDRPAVGGQEGEEAEEDFEGRKSRLRKATQVRYRGRKDSDIFDVKQIPANTPFSKWLRDQPEWFVKDTLGAKRGEMFLKGELNLANLTDKQLKPKTLEQLRKE